MKRLTTAIITLLLAGNALGATCKISEYESLSSDNQGNVVPVAREPALVTQNVTYTTSTQSNAFNVLTRFVRIVCDAKAHVVFSTSPTATATDPYIPADVVEYFGIFQVGASAGTIRVAIYDGSS